MWTTEHTTDTDITPAAVWAALRDLHAGKVTSENADTFELHGPFEVGTELTVTPKGQDPFTSVITEIVENEVYADRTEFDGLTLLFRHTLHALPDGGTRVTHRLEIDGPAADEVGPELGPQISGDFPTAMAELLTIARQR